MKRKLLSLSIALLIGCQAAHAYDRLGNMSTRGTVVPGPGGAMITGFIAEGTTEKCVVMRSRGPSMREKLPPAEQDLVLDDPSIRVLRFVSGSWTVVAENDNWQEQNQEDVTIIRDLGFAPKDPLEAAVFLCLVPGSPYSVITAGPTNNDGGLAIVEGLDADPISEIQNTDFKCGQECADLQNQIDSLQSQVDSIGPHTTRYTDTEAIAAVGPHFSGNHNDLFGVTANQHHTPSGGSSPVLDYMEIVDGQIVIEGIDVRILNGNFLIGTGGTGEGMHNFILGHDNEWVGEYNMIVGTNNSTLNDYTFIHGYYNYVRGSGNYGGVFGGSANLVETTHSIIAGGQNNQAMNAAFVSILGGEGRYTTYLNEVIADGTGSGN